MPKLHNELPVTPAEAKDLPTHVERCADRFMALTRWHYEISRRLWHMRLEAWIYRTLTIAALAAVAHFLRQLLEKMP